MQSGPEFFNGESSFHFIKLSPIYLFLIKDIIFIKTKGM